MSDTILQKAILDELDWQPNVNAARIAVTVRDGVVTLGGHVATYAEKLAAEKAVSRVKGVTAIVEQIEVELGAADRHSDEALAARIAQVLDWDITLPSGRIRATVQNGRVTLSGDVDWQYQKVAAFEDVHRLSGVAGVSNFIEVRPQVEASRVRERIVDSIRRSAELDAQQISIQASGGKVVLSGSVHSWRERSLAEQAAWSAPGVTEVRDEITIV